MMNRRQFVLTGLALMLSACGSSKTSSSAGPLILATDAPTLLYFYTPN
jgi:hypothetical protein